MTDEDKKENVVTLKIEQAVGTINDTIDIINKILNQYPDWLKHAIVVKLHNKVRDDEMQSTMSSGFYGYGPGPDDKEEPDKIMEQILGGPDEVMAFRMILKDYAKAKGGGKIPVQVTMDETAADIFPEAELKAFQTPRCRRCPAFIGCEKCTMNGYR